MLSSSLRVDAGVADNLLLNKPLLGFLELAAGNISVIWRILPKELEIVTSDRMVGVVQNGVKVLETSAPLLALGITDILGNAVVTVVGRVVQATTLNTTEDVVERTVLEQNPNNVLNFALQVGNRLLGTGLVAKGRGSLLVRRLAASPVEVGRGRGSQDRRSQKAGDRNSSNTRLHDEIFTQLQTVSLWVW